MFTFTDPQGRQFAIADIAIIGFVAGRRLGKLPNVVLGFCAAACYNFGLSFDAQPQSETLQ
ncbi:hypothetical protein [Cupriavidus sp. YAF13]|uniref:hypothetical protein n=1 Tax=Cupriavidus sp. YAF13 TaxID=3233075 RepID=UPI003F906618